MRRRLGLTLLELLVVLALVGLLLALTGMNARKTIERQEEAAFVTGVKRLFWDGGTRASSLGETLELRREQQMLVLYKDTTPIRRLRIPEGTTIDLPGGRIATFLPTGKVELELTASCSPYPSFAVQNASGRRCLEVSRIGEVREVLP